MLLTKIIISIHCLIVTSETKKSLRVFYGRDIADGEFPFVVLLATADKNDEIHPYFAFCTASMLSKSWVLTACHCFRDPSREVYVWYGNQTGYRPPADIKMLSKVLKIFHHPGFRASEYKNRKLFKVENDIALAHCEETILPSYGKLRAIDRKSLTGLPVVYVGGGRSQIDEAYKKLQVGEGMIVECGLEIRRWSNYVICVTPKCSKMKNGPSFGDSGGPFLLDGQIIGIMSMQYAYTVEPKTREVRWQGISPVSPYTDWISTIIKSNGENR